MGRKRRRSKSGPREGLSASARAGAGARHASWWATHGRDLKFLAVFFGLIALYYVLSLTAVSSERFFPWYLRLNAQAAVAFLNAVGFDNVVVHGKVMTCPAFNMTIARGCDGLDPSALYIAAVLASPVGLRRRLPAVVIGTLLLGVLNVVRIITLFLTGLYYEPLFDIMHLEIWQAAFIILALVFWAVWAARVVRPARRKAHAPG